jgi:L-asparaginase
MVKQHIHIIKMGGTIEFIDPAYDAMNKKLMQLDTTIESYLHNVIQPHFDFSTETVTMKDSRDINEEDRAKLTQAIRSTSHTNIIVTHGTFTMKLTAQFLEEQGLADKKVILTGSMIPITGFTTSDAGFNLGFVIASFASVDNGVYLSMNGGIFGADEVSKNEELFRFE